MPWDDLFRLLRDALAYLGGGAFLWKVVEAYRSRIRVKVADVTYDEHQEDEPVLSMELDNLGRHPLLLPRVATLRGLHLGYGTSSGWIRPRQVVQMKLAGDRRVEPVSSKVLVWRLDEEHLPQGGLYWVFWMRIVLRPANTSRAVTVRVPRLGVGTVNPVRYWIGYMMFRHLGKLTRTGHGKRK